MDSRIRQRASSSIRSWTLSVQQTKRVGIFVLPGLGRMKKVRRKARMGRNPATGEPIKISAKTAVKFYLAKAARDAVAPPRK